VPLDLPSEALAYWYLRLNGFLTIPNFIVHPDAGANQGTEIDTVGLRLPDRSENLVRPMADDSRLIDPVGRVHLVLTEAKRGEAAVNDSWMNPQRQNILRVVRSIGVAGKPRAARIATRVVANGAYLSPKLRVEILCLADRRSARLSRQLPGVRQVLWLETLEFIHERFTAYHRQKRSHGQWDAIGQLLWNEMESSSTSAAFAARFRVTE
jgi:hypothetical protein